MFVPLLSVRLVRVSYRLCWQDDPCSSLEGEVRPGILEKHQETAAEANEEEDMDEQPDQPGKEASKPKRTDIDDAKATPDRCKRSFLEVAEWLRVCFSCNPIGNYGGGIVRFLHCYRGQAGKMFSFLLDECCVTDDEDVGMTWNSQIWLDLDASVMIDVSTQPLAGR